MKKIFLVDDDAVVLKVYQQKLASRGFDVKTATDGLEAVRTMPTIKPDLVILDLMMPKLDGVEVLKFIRGHPQFSKVPVAILTNAFMSDQARVVNAMGVERAIIKADCTPAQMLEIVCEILGVTPKSGSPEAKPSAQAGGVVPKPGATHIVNRDALAESVRASIATLRAAHQEFANGTTIDRVQDLYRQVRHLTANAGLAQYQQLALLGGAFEAMLFELQEKPQFLNPSSIRTIATTVEFLGVLAEDVNQPKQRQPFEAQVLVVDDDPVACRIAQGAVGRAKLGCRTTENPLAALDMITQSQFDLVLLDVEMPQLNGFDLCRKLRSVPGYEKTPVIYVTSHAHFETRAKSVLAGGNDLIAKPVFPIELAVKSVLHIIKYRRSASLTAT